MRVEQELKIAEEARISAEQDAAAQQMLFFFSLLKLVMPVLVKSWVLVLQLYTVVTTYYWFLSELAKLVCVFFLLFFYPSLFHAYRIMARVQGKLCLNRYP